MFHTHTQCGDGKWYFSSASFEKKTRKTPNSAQKENCRQMGKNTNIEECQKMSCAKSTNGKAITVQHEILKISTEKKLQNGKKEILKHIYGEYVLKLPKTDNFSCALISFLVGTISALLKICAYKAFATWNMPLKRKHHVEILFTRATKAVFLLLLLCVCLCQRLHFIHRLKRELIRDTHTERRASNE